MRSNLLDRRISLILGLLVAVGSASAKTPVSYVRITVRIYDYVNLSANAHGEVAENAKRVLGQAGVLVDFVECYRDGVEAGGLGCTSPLGAADFVLRILEPKFAMKGEQLGYAAMAPEGGAYITVFTNPVRRRASVVSLTDG